MQVALFHTEAARAARDVERRVGARHERRRLRGEPDRVGAAGCGRRSGCAPTASRYDVTDRIDARNSGTATAGIVSPKGTVTLGPWSSTEFYVNAGTGFHSNSALGTTLRFDGNGNPAEPVTPLVRAKGAEVGVRTVAVPHLQSTVSLWTLRLGSELVYNGDIGATEPGPASKRYGVEFANYYSPTPWLVFDGDVSWSQARFAEFNEAGPYVPEAVDIVVSGGASVDNFHRTFGSLRAALLRPAAARRGQLGALRTRPRSSTPRAGISSLKALR